MKQSTRQLRILVAEIYHLREAKTEFAKASAM